MSVESPLTIGRRDLLRGGAVVAAGSAVLGPPARALAAPAQVRGGRPQVSHGVQSGDVGHRSGTVWARADRPARMVVEVSATSSFRDPRTVPGPLVTAGTDHTGKVRLTGLPADREVFYRVTFTDPEDGLAGEAVTGSFRTAPSGARDVRFVWSGDLAGQGWGINPDVGGYRIFAAMEERDPDFFLCSGDTVYADGPLSDTVPLPDGRTWRNIVTPEKRKVAETLDEFRGQFRYNLIDENLRRFAARVPQVNQWDDHEVVNNWYPGEVLDDSRYTERRVDVLAARAKRAFHEYLPTASVPSRDGRIYRAIRYGRLLDVFVLDMRSYKDPNDTNTSPVPDGGVFGRRQLDWLKSELDASRATWKVIAADLPLGLVVPDGAAMEGIAQGENAGPLGRELEVAELLTFVARRGITGTVWLTADVHYTAAHHYDPSRASYGDFAPFWEFVSGPLNAGTFGPNRLDGTFGPEAVFVAGGPRTNASPAEGGQHFGEVEIDGGSGELTVRLRDLDNRVLFARTLGPEMQ